MCPKVLDEFDAALLLLPELEVAVAARRDDEVRLGGHAMGDGIAMPV